MPGHHTHKAAGALAAVATILLTHASLPLTALWTTQNIARIFAGIAGGMFPDIDTKSRGQRLWYMLLVPLLGAAILMQHKVFICILCALGVIPPLLPHRGVTHELWFVLLAPLGGPVVASMYQPAYLHTAIDIYFFFVLGAITHLLLDLGPLGMFRRALPRGPHRRSRRRKK